MAQKSASICRAPHIPCATQFCARVSHPHMFRHTIVGMLMEAGNSIDIVSRFMGHSTSNITGQNYWVTNIQEINDSMNNPFDGRYQQEKKKEEFENLELKLLYEKKNAAMQIIYKYNVIIGQIVDQDGSAAEVKAAIFETLPNLEELLRNINESVSSTLSVSGGHSVQADIQ